MLLETDDEIEEILKNVKTIALVGASAKAHRASNRVMKFLLGQGYDVVPVNPELAGQELHGVTVAGSLAEIGQPIDLVDIFRNSEAAGETIDEAIAVGAGAIWTQLGVINQPATDRAIAAGLAVVIDRCPQIEIPRLGLLKNFHGG